MAHGAAGPAWVPDACTLPSADQPLRVAEFDALFAESLRAVERVSPVRARLVFDPRAEAVARDLTEREMRCCAFFGFTVVAAGASVLVDVTVPAGRADVLDGLVARTGVVPGRTD